MCCTSVNGDGEPCYCDWECESCGGYYYEEDYDEEEEESGAECST